MIWVVDGTRLKKDYPRFLKKLGDFRLTKNKGTYIVDFPEECFPSAWLASSVPVVFDFKGHEITVNRNDERNYIYFL